MSEVIETPLPPAVRNHWWWRPGWRAGRHFYACHLTLDDQPQLRALIAGYQQAISGLLSLDLIPPQWLHITMQGIGFTDEISRDELDAVADALTYELSDVRPPAVTFHYLTVHPEAVYLKAHPAEALYPLRIRMHHAVTSVLGSDRFTDPLPEQAQFIPHVSIAYINADSAAEPIARALQNAAGTPVTATFSKASLLVYHRDHRMYEWTSAGPIPIGPASAG